MGIHGEPRKQRALREIDVYELGKRTGVRLSSSKLKNKHRVLKRLAYVDDTSGCWIIINFIPNKLDYATKHRTDPLYQIHRSRIDRKGKRRQKSYSIIKMLKSDKEHIPYAERCHLHRTCDTPRCANPDHYIFGKKSVVYKTYKRSGKTKRVTTQQKKPKRDRDEEVKPKKQTESPLTKPTRQVFTALEFYRLYCLDMLLKTDDESEIHDIKLSVQVIEKCEDLIAHLFNDTRESVIKECKRAIWAGEK